MILMFLLQGKPGEPIRMKDEKELKPASMRVRDAAEALLTVVLEQVCLLHLIMHTLRITFFSKLKVVSQIKPSWSID
jgi:hypothetical protein